MNFDKTQFNWDGMYLTYSENKDFVARFKRKGDKSKFISFLCANFTTEEYFHEVKINNVPPLTILESKGYVSPTVSKILKDAGYPVTQKGKTDFLKDQEMIRREKLILAAPKPNSATSKGDEDDES